MDKGCIWGRKGHKHPAAAEAKRSGRAEWKMRSEISKAEARCGRLWLKLGLYLGGIENIVRNFLDIGLI